MQTLHFLAVTVQFENSLYQSEYFFFVSFIIFLVVSLFDFLFYRDTIIISSLLQSQNVNHSNNCGQMRGMCKSVKSNCSRILTEQLSQKSLQTENTVISQ